MRNRLCYPRRPTGPLSSRGLGRRPLTAETGVRIPVAVLRSPRTEGGFGVSGPAARNRARKSAVHTTSGEHARRVQSPAVEVGAGAAVDGRCRGLSGVCTTSRNGEPAHPSPLRRTAEASDEAARGSQQGRGVGPKAGASDDEQRALEASPMIEERVSGPGKCLRPRAAARRRVAATAAVRPGDHGSYRVRASTGRRRLSLT
jgi:hypothetical protein